MRLSVEQIMDKLSRSEGLTPQEANELRRTSVMLQDPSKNQLIQLSDRIINALPKQWGGDASSHELGVQLATKLARHNALLANLHAHRLLHLCKPATLQHLLENGEKVAALVPLQQALDVDPVQSLPLQAVIDKAGASLKASAKASFIKDTELFFASPGRCVSLFFELAEEEVTVAGQRQASTSQIQQHISLLASVALASLDAGRKQHEAQMEYSMTQNQQTDAVDLSWRHGEIVRSMLHLCGSELIRLLRVVKSLDDEKAGTILLLEVTYVLLEAYAAACGSVSSPKLAQEYAIVKQELLAAALEHAFRLATAGESDDTLIASVQVVAEAHLAYAQLFDISEMRGDSNLLFGYMLDLGPESSGPAVNMATYVFARLMREDRIGELLELPDVFNASLQTWLQTQKSSPSVQKARWLHALRVKDFQEAAKVLQKASKASSNVPDATRLTCISKLALIAAQPSSGSTSQEEILLEQANGALSLLDMQARLGFSNQPAMPANELLQEATKPGMLPQHALNILAAGGQDFRKQHRREWGTALESAMPEVDWGSLKEQVEIMPQQDDHAMEDVLAYVLGWSSDSATRPFIVGSEPKDSILDLLEGMQGTRAAQIPTQ